MFSIGQRVRYKKWYSLAEGAIKETGKAKDFMGIERNVYIVEWDDAEEARKFLMNRTMFEWEIEAIEEK